MIAVAFSMPVTAGIVHYRSRATCLSTRVHSRVTRNVCACSQPACACVCTREHAHACVRCESNTCALPKLMRITLWFLFCNRLTRKSRTVSSCDLRVHCVCVCMCAYSRATRECCAVTRERYCNWISFAKAIMLAFIGTQVMYHKVTAVCRY